MKSNNHATPNARPSTMLDVESGTSTKSQWILVQIVNATQSAAATEEELILPAIVTVKPHA